MVLSTLSSLCRIRGTGPAGEEWTAGGGAAGLTPPLRPRAVVP